MPHVVLVFYLATVIAGTFSISQAVTIWQRYRKLVIQRFILFLVALLLIALAFMVELYAQIAGLSGFPLVRALVWAFQAAGGVLYIVICPYLFHSLVGRALPSWQRFLFLGLDAAVVLAALGTVAFPTVGALPAALGGVLFAMILYGIVYTSINLGDVGERVVRRALVIFICLSAAFFPLMVIDSAMDELGVFSIFRFMNNLAQPAYFLVLTSLSIVFGMRYLSRPAYSEKGRLTEYFLTAFGVTRREAEIISLLMDGASFKGIGQKLFISPKTVENHVYNLYQKLGVRNRVQMFQMLSTNRID